MTKLGVVILHGFNSTPIFMKGIEFELRRWGKLDQVLNLSVYGSKWGIFPNEYNLSTPILKLTDDGYNMDTTLVEHVLKQLKSQVDPELDELILLGHSMGGLIWRTLYKIYFSKHQDDWLNDNSPNIIGLIQLATPNQGSKLTNMKVIKLFDKLQTSYILKFAGFSINLINKLIATLTRTEHKEMDDDELIQESTQIKQMRPNSEFLQWLNSDPTFVDKIPHYRIIGRKNSVLFTNFAWLKNSDNLDHEDILDELKEEYDDDEFDKILDEIDIKGDLDDKELERLKNYLEERDYEFDDTSDDSIIDQISLLFEEDNFTPNDSLVSIEDAKLPGSIQLTLGKHAEKISHFSICMWFLPFKPYRKVRNLVFETIEEISSKFE